MRVKEIFKKMVAVQASDLFLRTNSFPRARVDGVIQILEQHVISKDEMLSITNELLGTEERKRTYREKFDIDFVYADAEIGRFRVNVFTQRGSSAVVARHVIDQIKTFEELNLPVELCKRFSSEARGLILFCGPAGCGKSTAIASMMEYINQNHARHIVTIEDPIEFLFQDKQSMINQRELDLDVMSYASALKHVTQQSPDIIYIGNIRDQETMHAAIDATELGALVISTFHTVNATQTIERIINFFPPYLHNEVRMQLSMILRGVLSLRLIPCKDGKGRIPAYESMVVTPTIARLIRDGNAKEIQHFINQGELFGMKSFKQSLVELVKKDLVTEQDARVLADSRDEFDLELKGIQHFDK